MLNDMYSHVTGNEEEEREYFNRIILEAENYVKIHFATEERIMAATRFSGYAEHKIAHDLFISTVDKYISDFSSGRRLSLYSFTQSVKDWVLSHIAVMDKQYFVYIKKIATQKSNGRLSITSDDIQPAANTKRDKSHNSQRQIA